MARNLILPSQRGLKERTPIEGLINEVFFSLFMYRLYIFISTLFILYRYYCCIMFYILLFSVPFIDSCYAMHFFRTVLLSNVSLFSSQFNESFKFAFWVSAQYYLFSTYYSNSVLTFTSFSVECQPSAIVGEGYCFCYYYYFLGITFVNFHNKTLS